MFGSKRTWPLLLFFGGVLLLVIVAQIEAKSKPPQTSSTTEKPDDEEDEDDENDDTEDMDWNSEDDDEEGEDDDDDVSTPKPSSTTTTPMKHHHHVHVHKKTKGSKGGDGRAGLEAAEGDESGSRAAVPPSVMPADKINTSSKPTSPMTVDPPPEDSEDSTEDYSDEGEYRTTKAPEGCPHSNSTVATSRAPPLTTRSTPLPSINQVRTSQTVLATTSRKPNKEYLKITIKPLTTN